MPIARGGTSTIEHDGMRFGTGDSGWCFGVGETTILVCGTEVDKKDAIRIRVLGSRRVGVGEGGKVSAQVHAERLFTECDR